jgi:hypothetical protein
MGKNEYLRMKTEKVGGDFKELSRAATNLVNHTVLQFGIFGLGTTVLQWIASVAAIYLLVLDRTNWRTNMLTSLLIPYIFLSLPSLIFNILRGEIGRWIAFIAVIVGIFFPKRFQEWKVWLEMPSAFILIIVVAPYIFADIVRDDWIGLIICLVIAIYLLQEHIRASGGFKNSFTKANGVSNTVGIIILVVYPVFALFMYFL